jgi:NADH-quinone oxidoreductase subunit N
MVVAAASDLMELVVGVLLSATTGYVLAAWHRRSALSVEAGTRFFLVGALTNALLLVGVTLLYGLTGETRYQLVAEALGPGSSTVVLVAVVVLVVVGLGFEVGAVPAHAWLPDVAQGAPAPAAGFLTVAPKIGALVAMARLLPLVPTEVVDWRVVVAVVAVATMTVGNLLALWQRDLRRLLGWSSVSQAGYALLAVAVVGRSADAPTALVVFLAAYAAGQMAAFAVVARLRGRTAIDDYAGLFGRRPAAATVLALALLSFVGIPPLAGFVGKLLLFGVAIDGGFTWLAVVAVANTVVSLFYYLRVIAPMALDPAEDGRVVPVLGPWSATAVALGGVLVVGLGVAAEPLVRALSGTGILP